jgi:hypothetical protein
MKRRSYRGTLPHEVTPATLAVEADNEDAFVTQFLAQWDATQTQCRARGRVCFGERAQ